MTLPIYQVDAFTSRLFGGNPAAVVPLERWLPDAVLQAIASENNLAETAYFVPLADGSFHLRWFTPALEVDLCGHATLAAAFVLARRLGHGDGVLRFASRSGELRVACDGPVFTLDFPVWAHGEPLTADPGFAAALGAQPAEMYPGKYHLLVFDAPDQIRALRPDYRALAAIEHFAVIATAPGEVFGDADFVSRFFAPRAGIDEDPVTGSAHCVLTPYWSRRLGKTRLKARQISARGGELICELRGDRVAIAGHAVLYLRGEIEVPD